MYYNRFRYYDSESEGYISKDPIGLRSNEPNFYAYVDDPNSWIDIFGLNKTYSSVDQSNKKKNKKLLDDLDAGTHRSSVYANDPKKHGGALLPRSRDGKTITYTEHDIAPAPNRSVGTDRGVKRVVQGSDGRVYYTNDHYRSFTRIR